MKLIVHAFPLFSLWKKCQSVMWFENPWFSDVFRERQKRSVAWNGLTTSLNSVNFFVALWCSGLFPSNYQISVV